MKKIFVLVFVFVVCFSVFAESAEIKDGSGNIWTNSGKIVVSDVNSKGAASLFPAMQFDGKSYLQKENGISLGGKDFTIDGWAFVDTNCGNYGRIFEFNVAAKDSKNLILCRYGSGSDIAFYAEDKRSVISNCVDKLFHFAYVYKHDEGLVWLYINGELKGKIDVTIPRRDYSLAYLGKSSWDSDGMFVGYIYGFRITDGQALWTDNFTPPIETEKPVQEYNIEWKQHGEIEISDVNPQGSASLVPAWQFDGESYLQAENGISLGGRDFTIDGWAFVDTNCGNYGRIFEFNVAAKNTKNLILCRYGSGSDIAFYAEDKRSVISNCVDKLFHFAYVYEHSKNLVWIFVNGELKGKIDTAIPRRNYSIAYLGKSSWDSDGMFVGYLHGFRITDGKALWTEKFTPPTETEKSGQEISMSNFNSENKFTADGEKFLQIKDGISLGGRDFTIEGQAFIDKKCGNYGRIFEFNVAAKNTKNLMLCRYGSGSDVAAYAEDVRASIPDLVDKPFNFKFVYNHKKEIVWLYTDGELKGKINARIPRRNYSVAYIGKSSWDSDGMFVGYVEGLKIIDGVADKVTQTSKEASTETKHEAEPKLNFPTAPKSPSPSNLYEIFGNPATGQNQPLENKSNNNERIERIKKSF